MQLKDGFYVVCPCDDNLYSLVNGNIVKQGENAQKPYPLLNYRVVASGTTLNVYN
ncbi:hypothetical protein QIU18_11240 [Capnocytophaga canimorsus]|nr:hypothetical protein [Capnocytophaga canimorsus]WGU70084.1 hypothetical protein QIU18_11240 [Capnocytophaga canimorsus]